MFNHEKMVLSYLFPLLLVFILFLYLGLIYHLRSLLLLAWFEISPASGLSAPWSLPLTDLQVHLSFACSSLATSLTSRKAFLLERLKPVIQLLTQSLLSVFFFFFHCDRTCSLTLSTSPVHPFHWHCWFPPVMLLLLLNLDSEVITLTVVLHAPSSLDPVTSCDFLPSLACNAASWLLCLNCMSETECGSPEYWLVDLGSSVLVGQPVLLSAPFQPPPGLWPLPAALGPWNLRLWPGDPHSFRLTRLDFSGTAHVCTSVTTIGHCPPNFSLSRPSPLCVWEQDLPSYQTRTWESFILNSSLSLPHPHPTPI